MTYASGDTTRPHEIVHPPPLPGPCSRRGPELLRRASACLTALLESKRALASECSDRHRLTTCPYHRENRAGTSGRSQRAMQEPGRRECCVSAEARRDHGEVGC